MILTALNFCVKGDKITNDFVVEALNEGLDWQIKQYKKALEVRKQIKENTIEKQIADQIKYLNKDYLWYQKQIKLNTPFWFRNLCVDRITEGEHQLNKLKLKEKFITGRAEGLSAEAIKNAKNYPIGQIIDLDKRGFAVKNPFRNEKHSSFYCKGNFWHDFGTNESGDVIDLAMKIYKLDFKSAIEKLNK